MLTKGQQKDKRLVLAWFYSATNLMLLRSFATPQRVTRSFIDDPAMAVGLTFVKYLHNKHKASGESARV